MEWCDEYGTGSEEWTTKVEIKIKNVPEHANHPEIMERLVSFFCDAQTYRLHCMLDQNRTLSLKLKILKSMKTLKSMKIQML
uniref:Uncharacterized protein n=1 Tax=Oryza sativa subsp. japonica TaxID=39947 RepID=Q2R4F4_ORYSJ|nr:hypothetical protein LOC_Os11g28670 [Oryza sativa Japonica Group]